MMKRIQEYWKKDVPMSFTDQPMTYEKKREFRYGLQEYMHRIFRFEDWRGKFVLDLGCGAGIDSAEFLRNGANVVSLDLVKVSMASTMTLFREANLSGNLVQADALHLPFEEDVFDCVYSFGVLHHIPDVDHALNEVKRVLKHGGKFMGMLYNRDSVLFAYSIMYRGWLEGMTPEESLRTYAERRCGCPYVKAYTKEEANCLLDRFFVNVTTDVQYDAIDLPNKRKAKFQLQEHGSALGWHIIVKGEKS
jgi:ubiquinone/menaquinone biosynthesis C-methylase UbiE